MLHQFKLIVGASALFVLFALYMVPDRDQTIAALRQYAPLADYLQRLEDVEDVKTEHVQRKRKIRVGNATVQKMVNAIMEEDADFFPDWYWTATFATLVKTLGNGRRRYPGDYVLQSPSDRQKSDSEGWGPMDRHIRQYSLYQQDDPAVKDLMHRMATSKIETTRENRGGYHLKVDVKFSNGGWAVLKPMRKNTFPEYLLCNNINATHYKGDSRLLESLDVKYFDSLIDNYDRHHYATYRDIRNGTIPFLYDNSRGFGNPANDTIMVHFFDRARHCCLIKKSTFLKYLKLFLGPAPLSMFLRESLISDLAHTVLPDDELAALDRRVIRTVMFICNCLRDARHVHDVIIDDIV